MTDGRGNSANVSKALKRNDGALLVPRGASANVVESLRRRHVQAELQLREMEDRFRRDCARQEQELELLRLENSKYKAKIEEMRMAQTAPRENLAGDILPGGDSKLIKASSRKYCMARDAVEKARDELSEVQARSLFTRQRISELKKRHGCVRVRSDSSRKQSLRSCAEIELHTRASRLQLKGLEAHVEFETDRQSELVESAKSLRNELDVLLTSQRRNEELFRERENEMIEVMKESFFLIEVCNILVEERDSCQQELVELERLSQMDHDAYEKTFSELVGVEERDKIVKAKLREKLAILEVELQEVVKERENALRLVNEEDNSYRLATMGMVGDNDDDSNTDSIGVSRQVAEFERYINRFADLVGSDNLAEIERYVCEGGEGRFQLYSQLRTTQDALAALERERVALVEERLVAPGGSEAERSARAEVAELQRRLSEIQRVTLDHEQRTECVRACIDAALPEVRSVAEALGCEVARAAALSRRNATMYLAAVGQRVEEYMAAWVQRRQPAHVPVPLFGSNAVGLKHSAATRKGKPLMIAPVDAFSTTSEPERKGAVDPVNGDMVQALVNGDARNGGGRGLHEVRLPV